MYLCCLQDKYHLYFLFDLMSGGDLMDVLVAEAKVINRRVPQKSWQVRKRGSRGGGGQGGEAGGQGGVRSGWGGDGGVVVQLELTCYTHSNACLFPVHDPPCASLLSQVTPHVCPPRRSGASHPKLRCSKAWARTLPSST